MQKTYRYSANLIENHVVWSMSYTIDLLTNKNLTGSRENALINKFYTKLSLSL